MAGQRKSSRSATDAYRVWHVAKSYPDNGIEMTMTFYRSEMVPDIAGALEAAFRINQCGHRVLQIDGPEDFHIAGADLLNAFENRGR